MSKPMHSWLLGGERFISVSGMDGGRRGYKSLVEWLMRGHRKGCEGHNINSTGNVQYKVYGCWKR